MVIFSSFLVGKPSVIFCRLTVILPRHSGRVFSFYSDFNSIKSRLKSQVLLRRSQIYCQAVKVHWLPVDTDNLNIPVVVNKTSDSTISIHSSLHVKSFSNSRNNQSSFLFLKKKKVPSNTLIERETQEKEETTQRQSVKTCDMKIVVHTHQKKKKTRATRMVVTPKKKKKTKKKKEKENHLLNKGPNTPTEAPRPPRRRADSSHSNTAPAHMRCRNQTKPHNATMAPASQSV